jgi:hypothetical protein
MDATPLGHPCPECGSPAALEGKFGFGGREGYDLDVEFDLFRCAGCGKYHAECSGMSSTWTAFDPNALERFEIWQHDEAITWIGNQDREPTEYDRAVAALRAWASAKRACDNGTAEATDPPVRAALEGRRLWDDLMQARVEEERNRETETPF